jgi:3-oxoacyl-(acyl-carrier-protein) synthase
VDPAQQTVEWFVRGPDGFVPADGSAILGITHEELAAAIDWPA